MDQLCPHGCHLSRPLHLQRLKSQHHGKSSWECPLPLICPARGVCSGVYHAFISFLSLGPLASPPGGYWFLSGSVRLRLRWWSNPLPRTPRRVSLSGLHGRQPSFPHQHAGPVWGYWWSSCPGGPALWYCTLSWVAGSVRSAFAQSWPCFGRPRSHFSVVGKPSHSRFPRVRSACTVLLRPSLAGTFLPPRLASCCPSR